MTVRRYRDCSGDNVQDTARFQFSNFDYYKRVNLRRTRRTALGVLL